VCVWHDIDWIGGKGLSVESPRDPFPPCLFRRLGTHAHELLSTSTLPASRSLNLISSHVAADEVYAIELYCHAVWDGLPGNFSTLTPRSSCGSN
jgi:hypothetical protein